MANRRSGRGWIFVLIIVSMACWSIYQLFNLVEARTTKHEASRLLYQVALFQIELLSHILDEAGKATNADGLNGLKLAAYSANYTHERLMMAIGGEQLLPLSCLSQLLQFILSLQIGGQRPLKADEVQTIVEVSKLFKPFYDIYTNLISSNGEIISSQNNKLGKLDKSISEYIRKKELQ